jgi:hypothetical protein
MPDLPGFSEFLSPPDVRNLSSVNVVISPGRERSLAVLVDGWCRHVARLESESGSMHATDGGSWTVHDYIAALLIRDWVSEGLMLVPEPLRERVGKLVEWCDVQLLSFTEPDGAKLFARFASEASGEDLAGKGWWWNRIPSSGPVLEDLLEWKKAMS